MAAAHFGEARAHARPARRGARSTPWGYAPLESSGNGCLFEAVAHTLKGGHTYKKQKKQKHTKAY